MGVIKTKAELVKLVLAEVEGLRKYASKAQKARLILKDLDVNSSACCIYGLMTGTCFSEASINLFKKCGVKITFGQIDGWTSLKEVLESSTIERKTHSRFTPMEAYIGSRPKDAIKILQYIKGTSDEIKLTNR